MGFVLAQCEEAGHEMQQALFDFLRLGRSPPRAGIARGHQSEDRGELAAVSYYRLSAYWVPFRQADASLLPGTTLEIVWRRYVFDRQLRLLVIGCHRARRGCIRTQIVNRHTLAYGPFGYLDRANLPVSRSMSSATFSSGFVMRPRGVARHYSGAASPNTPMRPICLCGWPAS